MQTSFLPSTQTVAKAMLVQLLVTCCFALQTLNAQSVALASQPAPSNNKTTTSSLSFQSLAFPITNAHKVRVIFEDPTGRGAVIQIRNAKRQIIHSQNCFRKKVFMGNFDLSLLPDGSYSVAIVPLTKIGFNKQAILHPFQMQTQAKRSITPLNKEPQKEIVTPKHYQVRR